MSTPDEAGRLAIVRFAEAAAAALSNTAISKTITQAFEAHDRTEARRRIACAQRTEQQIEPRAGVLGAHPVGFCFTLTLTDAQLLNLTIALVLRRREKVSGLKLFRSAAGVELGLDGLSAEMAERDIASVDGIVDQLPDWCQKFVASEIAREVAA